MSNGALLSAAESAGFEVLITVDKNMRFQQGFSKRAISLVTLNSLFVTLDQIVPLAPNLQSELVKGIAPGTVLVL